MASVCSEKASSDGVRPMTSSLTSSLGVNGGSSERGRARPKTISSVSGGGVERVSSRSS